MNNDEPIVMGLRLGKKDIILKRWLQLAKQANGGQTSYLKLALISYMKNTPIKIGVINPYADVSVKDVIKTLTFTKDDGDLYAWIFQQKQEDKHSTKIKRILTQCIEITEGEESVSNYAVLLAQMGESYRTTDSNKPLINESASPENKIITANINNNLKQKEHSAVDEVKMNDNNVVNEVEDKQSLNIMRFVTNNIKQGSN